MVQVIENWSDVQGKIISIAPHPSLHDFLEAEIQIDGTSPVEAFPNLFANHSGQQLKVNLPAAAVPSPPTAIGRTIRARIKRAGPGVVFAHPDQIEIV